MSTIEASFVQDKKVSEQITDTIEHNSRTGTNNAIREMDVNVVTRIQFLLCQSCFWCASYIGLQSITNYEILTQCVICKNGKIESLPISSNESYKFDYSKTHGIELTFQRK